MRFRAVVVGMSASAVVGLSGCDHDLFEDDNSSLASYTCTKPSLRDAGQLAETLTGIGFKATLIPACDSSWAYVQFKPTVSIGHAATELTKVFNCGELTDPGSPQTIALRCTIEQSQFVAVLSWYERKLESGKPQFRRDGQAVLVRDKSDEDVVLVPVEP